MKSYRLSRTVSWFLSIAKILLTAAAGVVYILAVTHPTPLGFRLLLLLAMAVFIWFFYFRLPSMPTEIDVNHDGWIDFRGRRGNQQIHVASIRSIGRGLLGKTVRVRDGGGKVRMTGGVKNFYDFLSTVKGMNPAIDIRGF
jgi:hypothetical protein